MLIDFNINEFVFVQLTNAGREALRRQHFEMFRGKIEYHEPKEDGEGWSKWQLWDLMQNLGSAISLGNVDQPFKTGMRFEVRSAVQPAASLPEQK